MGTISLRLSNEDANLFRSYADMNNMSLSEMIRSAVYKQIEDEFDLKAFDAAMAEYKANPVRHTHEEVREMLDLD